MKRLPTLARMRELLTYDPVVGTFVWNVDRNYGPAAVRVGDTAGSAGTAGYLILTIDGTKINMHRAAFFYMTGRWPKADVDHIDGDRQNNRWPNLRGLTRSQNNENAVKANRNNKSGFRGVHKTNGIWWASIQVNKRKVYLGTHPTPEAAHDAYMNAKREFHVAAARGITCQDRGKPQYKRGEKA